MSQRYQREIEEILRQAGEWTGGKGGHRPRKSVWRVAREQLRQAFAGRAWSISPGRVMLLAVALLLTALLIRAMIPGIVGPLAWAGLVLFIVGYAMFFIKPPKMEKRWRGHSLDDSDAWWNRFRRRPK